jgi:hypothetical protein
MSCCNDAANILVKVLGGEDKTREIVGGVKWWQVRGIEGWVHLFILFSLAFKG